MKIIELDSDLGPIAFLEGGSGLEECEDFIYRRCIVRDIDCWKLDSLYEYPEKMMAIQYLRPKTIIVGTTGVYKDKIQKIVEHFQSIPSEYIENVIITHDENGLLKYLAKQLVNIRILQPEEFYDKSYSEEYPIKFIEV